MRLRKQYHASAAPTAMPTRGPATTPAIHVLFCEDATETGANSVGCGAPGLELDETIFVRVVMGLEDAEVVAVEPEEIVSTMRL